MGSKKKYNFLNEEEQKRISHTIEMLLQLDEDSLILSCNSVETLYNRQEYVRRKKLAENMDTAAV